MQRHKEIFVTLKECDRKDLCQRRAIYLIPPRRLSKTDISDQIEDILPDASLADNVRHDEKAGQRENDNGSVSERMDHIFAQEKEWIYIKRITREIATTQISCNFSLQKTLSVQFDRQNRQANL